MKSNSTCPVFLEHPVKRWSKRHSEQDNDPIFEDQLKKHNNNYNICLKTQTLWYIWTNTNIKSASKRAFNSNKLGFRNDVFQVRALSIDVKDRFKFGKVVRVEIVFERGNRGIHSIFFATVRSTRIPTIINYFIVQICTFLLQQARSRES
jgi:hypothetical protein